MKYTLSTIINGKKYYVSAHTEPTPEKFTLTVFKDEARRFIGNGKFSGKPIANSFQKQFEKHYTVMASGYGNSWGPYLTREEALEVLTAKAEQGYSCLSIKENN